MLTPMLRLLFSLLLFNGLISWSHAQEITAPRCSGDERITEHFDNGAVWDFCWESRVRENLVLSDVFYTPPDGLPQRVLSSARLGQLHVAYDDNIVTYNDVTQFGLGGDFLTELTEADCPFGERLRVQTRYGICKWRNDNKQGYRTPGRSVKAASLNLFSISQVGAYAYISSWSFYANGAIEPSIGATGALQRSSEETNTPYGRLLQGDSENLWLSHTHNYYWRLDFDLGSQSDDDHVVETSHRADASGLRQTIETQFDHEVARRIDPESQLFWTVYEHDADDAFGYRIEPVRHGHNFERKEVEPFTDYDFFVTVASDCERYASQNSRFNPECADDVLQYTNEQSLDNADLVAWYRVAFHHVPRSEDQRNMHTHWDGFVLDPINMLPGTNELSQADNSPPVLTGPTSFNHNPGEHVHTHMSADDADNDVLTYTASGLPPGITFDVRGHFNGSPTTAGVYRVNVVVSDDLASDQQELVWTVGSTESKGGAGFWVLLICGLLGRFRFGVSNQIPDKTIQQCRSE